MLIASALTSETSAFLHKQPHAFMHAGEILIVVTCMFILGYTFSKTGLRELVERKLPDTKWAPFYIIMIVGLLSMVVDNIAMALIGKQLLSIFPAVNPAMYVNIVAASNAGGSPTPTGDTTTFMIANRGYNTLSALGPALTTLIILGLVSVWQQSKKGLAQKKFHKTSIEWNIIGMMVMYVLLGIGSLLYLGNGAIGFGIGAAFLMLHLWKEKHLWIEVKKGLSAGFFLFLLIISVGQLDLSILPDPSNLTAFWGGIASQFLDNIPMTEAMLSQPNPYPNWGMVAFAVGSFGSANWWASSAGVAMCEEVHVLRSITTWLKYSWWLWIAQPAVYWLWVWIYATV